MIVFLATGSHTYTFDALRRDGRVETLVLPYQQAFRARRLRRATYVFTDLDRLGFWDLELAARLYRWLSARGSRVLNDPARARQRYDLLRTLKAEGLNSFDVWRVAETTRPARFPVFLRTDSAHRGPCSDLLHDQAAVDKAVRKALSAGIPRRELLLVEYCAEPVRENLFRKHAAFRIGARIITSLGVHETAWAAKHGSSGVAGAALYDEEYRIVRDNRYADALWPVFRAAEIAYGRADFGVVDGRVEVYEINTNPHIKRLASHAYPVRMEAEGLVFDGIMAALAAVDTRAGHRSKVRDVLLRQQRRFDRRWPPLRWTP